MKTRSRPAWCVILTAGMTVTFVSFLLADDKSAAERGWEAMIGRTFSPPPWSPQAYENAWKQWGLTEKPADYERAFMDRYGLLAAPFDNRGLHMGMREAFGPLGKGITNDCLLCHAGSVAGQTYIGLGNASLDIQSLYEDLFAANGLKMELPFTFSNVRGTFEAAAGITYLMQFRDTDLNVRSPVELGSRSDTCASMPAWWNIKKKKTMYYTGGADARTVRSLTTFMLSPLNSGAYIKKQEPVFTDIQAWLLTLQPPKYPFEVDDKLAARGEKLFAQNCARCHGTYGPDGKYPNKCPQFTTC